MNKLKKIFCSSLIFFIFLESAYSKLEDAVFITVENKAITKSDIVNEIKIILILNNETYSVEKKDKLNQLAVKSTVERKIKEIEIEKYDFLKYSSEDLKKELNKYANRINVDLDTLKNICESNELDFSLIEDQIRIELVWNSLIFHLYRDRLKLNADEIEEQLKLLENKDDSYEFLISEIIINMPDESNVKLEIDNVKEKIRAEGFENVAINLSISQSSSNGGDLGWVNENVIAKKYKSKILKTQVGKVSEPILTPEGILFFQVRDKRKIKKDLEKEKNLLVYAEKTKILLMHSSSHYDKLKRSMSIAFFND